MAKMERRERSLALYETILKLKDLDECCRFFRRPMEKTGASSATISRVRRSMLDNGAGGVMQDVILREGLGTPDKK